MFSSPLLSTSPSDSQASVCVCDLQMNWNFSFFLIFWNIIRHSRAVCLIYTTTFIYSSKEAKLKRKEIKHRRYFTIYAVGSRYQAAFMWKINCNEIDLSHIITTLLAIAFRMHETHTRNHSFRSSLLTIAIENHRVIIQTVMGARFMWKSLYHRHDHIEALWLSVAGRL
jgi:hypothetical protein